MRSAHSRAPGAKNSAPGASGELTGELSGTKSWK